MLKAIKDKSFEWETVYKVCDSTGTCYCHISREDNAWVIHSEINGLSIGDTKAEALEYLTQKYNQ